MLYYFGNNVRYTYHIRSYIQTEISKISDYYKNNIIYLLHPTCNFQLDTIRVYYYIMYWYAAAQA